MDTANLGGRTVLVTGAGSGIGRETALLAARRGADLVVCDVDEVGLAATEADARALGRDVLARRVDVSDREQMSEFAAAVGEAVGAVDLLMNNAGVGLAAEFLETELSDWDWIVSINLLGVVHGCKLFVPPMVDRGIGGHVVNVSSAAGYLASPVLTAYSSTKFAVLGLSEALREELRPHGIGVTAICPGLINTPITMSSRTRGASSDPARRERIAAMYRRRNYGPDRVARNILKAVARNRTVAPVSPEAWFGYGLKRLSPRLTGWVARRTADLGDR
ncbi:MAG TPA: SDR family NAD(P)-dependent oxidoreductase [Solirubrobacterales bacterium]